MTHRGPFQPRPFCGSVKPASSQRPSEVLEPDPEHLSGNLRAGCKWRRGTASQELYCMVLAIHHKLLRRLQKAGLGAACQKSREKWDLLHAGASTVV